MMNRMHVLPGLLVLLSLAVVGGELLAPRSVRAQDGGHPAPTGRDSAKLFAKNCASCHVYPDAALSTDQAWLGQIMETS
jgi:hypothetical protein